MSIGNIRYWNVTESNSSALHADVKDEDSFFLNDQNSFNSTLFDIFSQSGFNAAPLYSNSFFGYNLNSPAQLREAVSKAKSMGMEKVLSAQLSSPLPFSNQNSDNSNLPYSGLSGVVNLTMQLELARAQRVFDQLKPAAITSKP